MGTTHSKEYILTIKEARQRLSSEQFNELRKLFRMVANKSQLLRTTIDKKAFCAQFGEALLRVDLDAAAIFDSLDVNGDTQLNEDEFISGWFIFAYGTDDEKLRLLFRAFDRDANGELTKNEVKKMLHGTAKNTRKLLASIVAEASGMKPGDRLPGSTKVINELKAHESEIAKEIETSYDHLADQIFLEADEDRNNCITFDEFRNAAHKSPVIRSWLAAMRDDIDEDAQHKHKQSPHINVDDDGQRDSGGKKTSPLTGQGKRFVEEIRHMIVDSKEQKT